MRSAPKQGGNNTEKLQGIYINPICFYRPVKVRPADPPGGSAQPDLMTSGNVLAVIYLNLTQVRIKGKYVCPVVDDDDIAGIKQVLAQSDDAGIGCIDGGADFCTKVGAPVVASMLTVK